MKSRICCFCIASLCILFGCTTKGQKDIPKNPEVNDNSIGNNIQSEASSAEPSDKSSDNSSDKSSECINGSTLKDNKCICEDGSEQLGEGWYCLKEGQKCFAESGCIASKITWPIGVIYRNNQFLCDNNFSPENVIEYECSSAGWKCIQNECHCGDNVISNNSICDDESKYICENDAWVRTTYKHVSDNYCDGIALSAIDPSSESEDSSDYKCRYHQWVCSKQKGCTCLDGESEKHISFGDICENSKAICKNAKSPVSYCHFPKLDYSSSWNGEESCESVYDYKFCETETNAQVCLKDSCPCGDGACMKYGVCNDGVCSCGNIKTNNHDEFYCSIYSYSVDLSEKFYDGEVTYHDDGQLICLKEEGCHTRDGRHYPKGAVIGFNGMRELNNEEFSKHDALMYHIDAGFDTTEESTSIFGECVLDRKDSLVRHSLANGADTFICDQSKCACGDDSCRMGEICDHGNCRPDSCQAESKTKWICDTSTDDGQMGFPNPLDPNKCIMVPQINSWFSSGYHSPLEFNKIKDRAAHYDYEEDEDDMVDFEEEVKKFDNEYRSSGQMYYDVIQCKGGHRYCHGKNNTPIHAPNKIDDYLCMDVDFLPNTDAKDHLKAWVCNNPKGCVCGNSKCKYKTDACIDNVCVNIALQQEQITTVKSCRNLPLKKGYRCESESVCGGLAHGFSYEKIQVCNQETCTCGKHKCKKGQICSNGLCLVSKSRYDDNYAYVDKYYTAFSSNNYDDTMKCTNIEGCLCNGENIHSDDDCLITCFGDGKLDENGCWCGKTKLDEDDLENKICLKQKNNYIIVCNNPEGCECGDTKCPVTTYCRDNQCIDPLKNQVIASSSDKLMPVSSCKDETCSCGQNECHEGQFCIAGLCRDRVYMRIKDGYRIFYDETKTPIDEHCDDPDECKDRMISEAWNNIELGVLDGYLDNSLPLSEYSISNSVKKEYCCCDDYRYYLQTNGYRCSLNSGCTCGSNKCSNGALCIEGKCVYDESYFSNYCQDSDIFISESQSCKGTLISPITDEYISELHEHYSKCEKYYSCEALGWQCNSEKGCLCGDVRCSTNEYCIKPGLCAGIKQK